MIHLDSDCKETDWKELASEVSLDLWILRKFNCLPTEQRFKELTEHQKVLMFYGYLSSPNDELIRDNYLHESEEFESEVISDQDKVDFENLGYTEEQIENIERNMKAAGLM